MSEKIKGIFGSQERAEEVKEWLKSQGAKIPEWWGYTNDENIYFIQPNGDARRLDKTYEYLFDIVEPPKPRHEFKPFDKVLVRDEVTEIWKPYLYGFYREGKQYPHLTIGGNTYKLCIPFKGNEHLVGTTKNPEEE